jgi:hypothetical protein
VVLSGGDRFVQINIYDRQRGFRFALLLTLLPFLIVSLVCARDLTAEVGGSFLYTLSNFTGPIRYSTPRIALDSERNEVSVLYQNSIRVFNDSGMEIYRFGEDLDIGHIVDVASDRDGNILLLAYAPPPESTCRIVRCNFRGEPRGTTVVSNLPKQFDPFAPQRMIYHNGQLYLANMLDLKIVIADLDGNFKQGLDLFPLVGLQEKDRGNVEMSGFTVADDGSILFTIPVLFSAYRLYPDGKLDYFGKPGGAPGRFNIVGGIALDSKGNYLVADKLKCTVMVFDKNFNFVTQFGFRGPGPGNLIIPEDLVIDKSDRVYVTQNGRRGVSVFKMTY